MKDIIKKSIGKALREPIMLARENSVFTDDGRVFLDAAASVYGAAVNMQGDIIDAKGKKIEESDPFYKLIISSAKKQARSESKIGGGLIGP
tara:strand:- start:306 stop:578 length:273 start_codon:yes stop_codon:yes gene_type:complete